MPHTDPQQLDAEALYASLLEQVKAAMGYHPERWIAEVAARRLRDYAPDIQRHDEIVLESNPLVPVTKLTRKVNDGQAA